MWEGIESKYCTNGLNTQTRLQHQWAAGQTCDIKLWRVCKIWQMDAGMNGQKCWPSQRAQRKSLKGQREWIDAEISSDNREENISSEAGGDGLKAYIPVHGYGYGSLVIIPRRVEICAIQIGRIKPPGSLKRSHDTIWWYVRNNVQADGWYRKNNPRHC